MKMNYKDLEVIFDINDDVDQLHHDDACYLHQFFLLPN